MRLRTVPAARLVPVQVARAIADTGMALVFGLPTAPYVARRTYSTTRSSRALSIAVASASRISFAIGAKPFSFCGLATAYPSLRSSGIGCGLRAPRGPRRGRIGRGVVGRAVETELAREVLEPKGDEGGDEQRAKRHGAAARLRVGRGRAILAMSLVSRAGCGVQPRRLVVIVSHVRDFLHFSIARFENRRCPFALGR